MTRILMTGRPLAAVIMDTQLTKCTPLAMSRHKYQYSASTSLVVIKMNFSFEKYVSVSVTFQTWPWQTRTGRNRWKWFLKETSYVDSNAVCDSPWIEFSCYYNVWTMYFPGLLQIQNRLGLQAAWIGFSLVSFFHLSSPPAAFISLFDTCDPAHASLSQFSISIRIAIAVSPITQGSGASVPPYFGRARQEVPTPDGMGLAHYRPIYGARAEKEWLYDWNHKVYWNNKKEDIAHSGWNIYKRNS